MSIDAPPPAAPSSGNEELVALVSKQNRELEAIRARDSASTIDNAVTSALVDSGAEFVPGALDQLKTLLRPRVQIVADANGQTGVFGPGLSPVKDYLGAILQTAEYSHFLRAKNPQGGTAGGQPPQIGPSPSGPANSAARAEPRNLGEYVVLRQLGEQAARGTPAPPNMDVSQPIGLKRTR